MSKDAVVPEKLDRLTTLVTAEFKVLGEHVARMEGRLDEQSRILAAMIPTTLAAGPSSRHQHPPAE